MGHLPVVDRRRRRARPASEQAAAARGRPGRGACRAPLRGRDRLARRRVGSDRRRLLPLLRRAAAVQSGGTPTDARDRPPRGPGVHARDLARRRGAPRAARDRPARGGRCLAGDAAHQLEHGRPRRGDPRRGARAPRRALERGTASAGLDRGSGRDRRGGPGLGHAGGRERRVPRLGRPGSRRARPICRSASATSGTRTTPRSRGPSARPRC